MGSSNREGSERSYFPLLMSLLRGRNWLIGTEQQVELISSYKEEEEASLEVEALTKSQESRQKELKQEYIKRGSKQGTGEKAKRKWKRQRGNWRAQEHLWIQVALSPCLPSWVRNRKSRKTSRWMKFKQHSKECEEKALWITWKLYATTGFYFSCFGWYFSALVFSKLNYFFVSILLFSKDFLLYCLQHSRLNKKDFADNN